MLHFDIKYIALLSISLKGHSQDVWFPLSGDLDFREDVSVGV